MLWIRMGRRGEQGVVVLWVRWDGVRSKGWWCCGAAWGARGGGVVG